MLERTSCDSDITHKKTWSILILKNSTSIHVKAVSVMISLSLTYSDSQDHIVFSSIIYEHQATTITLATTVCIPARQ